MTTLAHFATAVGILKQLSSAQIIKIKEKPFSIKLVTSNVLYWTKIMQLWVTLRFFGLYLPVFGLNSEIYGPYLNTFSSSVKHSFLVFFWSNSLNGKENALIIESKIQYIKTTERFITPLLCAHLSRSPLFLKISNIYIYIYIFQFFMAYIILLEKNILAHWFYSRCLYILDRQ